MKKKLKLKIRTLDEILYDLLSEDKKRDQIKKGLLIDDAEAIHTQGLVLIDGHYQKMGQND